MDRLIKMKEASYLLGVSYDTLRNWDKNGKLCSIKTFGGHRRYKLTDVETLLNGKNLDN